MPFQVLYPYIHIRAFLSWYRNELSRSLRFPALLPNCLIYWFIWGLFSWLSCRRTLATADSHPRNVWNLTGRWNSSQTLCVARPRSFTTRAQLLRSDPHRGFYYCPMCGWDPGQTNTGSSSSGVTNHVQYRSAIIFVRPSTIRFGRIILHAMFKHCQSTGVPCLITESIPWSMILMVIYPFSHRLIHVQSTDWALRRWLLFRGSMVRMHWLCGGVVEVLSPVLSVAITLLWIYKAFGRRSPKLIIPRLLGIILSDGARRYSQSYHRCRNEQEEAPDSDPLSADAC